MKMSGNDQFGVIVSNTYSYDAAELLLNKPLEISGSGTTGVVFSGWMDLDGGTAFSRSTADNIITTLPGTTRESVLNVDLTSTSKGILVPRMTTAQRTAITASATGLLVYDTSLQQFWY